MTVADPIAIVGISCRLPGASGPVGLWSLLRDGVEAIGDPPADRGLGIERGGFIERVDEFDADFFGISPREAAAMDPHQRLALELSWEGLEDAALVPERAARAGAGVFLGVMAADYAHVLASAGRQAITAHTLTGLGRALIANRISYALGFSAPSLTVDTGQSSSLAAVHLACESLRKGECGVALAGGVSLMLSPLSTEITRRFGALSPDGRCFAWDERASGLVRGEGGGMVVLKPLTDAVAHGDRVYAVIRGSALTSGSAESGISVPSARAQEQALSEALRRSSLEPGDVQYVELHGTGTPVGDRVEARALAGVYGRPGRPTGEVAVGSVKTNIGHLEGAAGIAGLLKAALCVHHGELVASLNFRRADPRVPLHELGVRVADRNESWPHGRQPRRAGVSSFGVGGSNCHLIIEQAPRLQRVRPELAPAPAGAPVLLSGASAGALREQARRLHERLERQPELRPADVAFSLATGRAHLERRAAVVAGDREALLSGLSRLAAGEPSRAVTCGGGVTAGRAVFTFPGQGAQWDGMAVELLDDAPAFAESMAACERALQPLVGWSLEGVLRGAEGAPTIDRVDVVQPALWAVMVSLAALWRRHGVEPWAVVGHSQGEIAAACVAGALSLADGARVVAMRSQAIAEALAGQGGMVAVSLDPAAVEELLARWPGKLSIAAVNGPRSVVVSGETAALEGLVAAVSRQGGWTRKIPVDYPSHSRAVERLEDRLLADLAPIRPRSATVPFFSTVVGRRIDTAGLDAGYWYRGLRDQVRFADATRALIDAGADAFLEISPHPVLTIAVGSTVEAAGAVDRVAAIGTLHRRDGGLERFTRSLAEAHAHGCAVDWPRVFAGRDVRRVELPTYAFQRRRHALIGDPVAADCDALEHPLLTAGTRLGDTDRWLFSGRLSVAAHGWLERYAVGGACVAPATVFVELAWRAGTELGCSTIAELSQDAALCVPRTGALQLQALVEMPDEAGRRQLVIYARSEERGAVWRRHAHAVLAPDAGGTLPLPRGQTAEVALEPADIEPAARFGIHPALLDRALPTRLEAGGAEIAVAWRGIKVGRSGAASLEIQLAPAGASAYSLVGRNAAGEAAIAVDAVAIRPLAEGDLGRDERALFETRWSPVALPDAVDPAEVPVLDDRSALGELLRSGDVPDAVVLATPGASPKPWLNDARLGTSRLILATTGGVSTVEGERVEPAAGRLWEESCAIQAEHRWRLVLVDRAPDQPCAWSAILASGEPRLALRDGRALAPRLVPVSFVAAAGAAEPERALARSLAAAPQAAQAGLVLEVVREHVADVLGHPSAAYVDSNRRFRDLGFDSLLAVVLRNRLAEATGVALPTTVVFDHPTAAALAAFLLARLDGARATGAATPVEADTAGDEGLAAIDEMDVDDLIRMTYETTRSAVEG